MTEKCVGLESGRDGVEFAKEETSQAKRGQSKLDAEIVRSPTCYKAQGDNA